MGLQSFILFTPVHSIPASALFFIYFFYHFCDTFGFSQQFVIAQRTAAHGRFQLCFFGFKQRNLDLERFKLLAFLESQFLFCTFQDATFSPQWGPFLPVAQLQSLFPTDPAPLSTRDIACSCPENPLYRHFPKHQQMIDHLIHKIAVVRHDDRTSFEVPQIFLQHIQRDDIQVVRRFVEHKKVRATHQDRAEI